jgi:prepilin-type N-terminal cleavage/methylation domain-containing protein
VSRRRGFSLAELVVALVIAGIIGIALSRLLINQSRFVANQDGMMRARASARAGLNVIVQELRMVGWGGLLQAHKDSITVRVPYAFGVACSQPSGGWQAVLLMPYDSATYASASLRGYVWRDALGTLHFVEPATLGAGAATDCSGLTRPIPASGSALPTGTRFIRLSPNTVGTPAGAPVYLYQRVRYELATSGEIPGRTALWRTQLDGGTREELVAPFQTANTSFAFLVGNGLRYQATVPAVLDSVRGIRLRLVGESEEAPQGRTAPSRFFLTTDIVFVNHGP